MLRRFAPFVFCLRVFTGCAPDAENNAADNSVTLPEEPAALEHRTACASLQLLRNDSPERAPAGIEATLSTLNSDPLLRLVEKRLREAGRIETFLAPYRASDTKPDALGVLKRHSEAEEDLIAFSKAKVEYNSLRRDLEVQLALYRTMVGKMRDS